MTRYGHLSLSDGLRSRLVGISAATIDRLREQAFGAQPKRAGGIGNAIRRAFPIRTFADWNDPLPGYIWKSTSSSIAGGVKIDGDFVHSLVMIDPGPNVWRCRSVTMHSLLSTLSAGTGRTAISIARSRQPSRHRLHERISVRLLQDDGHLADAFACLHEERSGMGRAEERFDRKAAGGPRRTARDGGYGNAGVAIADLAPVHQLICRPRDALQLSVAAGDSIVIDLRSCEAARPGPLDGSPRGAATSTEHPGIVCTMDGAPKTRSATGELEIRQVTWFPSHSFRTIEWIAINDRAQIGM
jgi:hypothetical protein